MEIFDVSTYEYSQKKNPGGILYRSETSNLKSTKRFIETDVFKKWCDMIYKSFANSFPEFLFFGEVVFFSKIIPGVFSWLPFTRDM